MAMIDQEHIPPSSWQQERAELHVRTRHLENHLNGLEQELEKWRQRALAAEVLVKTLTGERADQAAVLEALKAEFDALKQQVYGKTSEKTVPVDRELKKRGKVKRDPAKEAERRRKNKEAREKLETERVNHPVDRTGPECPECGRDREDFAPVGDGRQSVTYEYIPAKFIRQKHYQEVLACPCGEHMVVAEGPAKLGEGGGNYGPGFVSHLMVSRSADAIPFYRMEKQFQRLGIPIARSTMVGVFHRYSQDLRILVNRLFELIRASDVVLADETPMKMQLKFETGKDGKGYVWVFIADNLIAYRFSPSRSGRTPLQILGGSTGTLVVDAYTGYNQVTRPDGRRRAGCMAHARRKFHKALNSTPEAREALDLILELYLVEHEAKELGVVRKPRHLVMRKARSAPIMARLHKWLLDQQDLHLPKGPMGKAISYALNNWKELSQFLKSEQIPIDNNRSERQLRIVALHRKNSLFVGHDEAGENHAVVLSLVATCQANGVNPQEYLADILLRIQSWPQARLDDLLPHNWQRLKDAGELPTLNPRAPP